MFIIILSFIVYFFMFVLPDIYDFLFEKLLDF